MNRVATVTHDAAGAARSAAALIGAYLNNKSWKMTDFYLEKSMATPETLLPEGYRAAKDANRYHFGFCS